MLALVSVSLGCAAPDNALVHSCSRSVLDLSSRCHVRAKQLDKDQFTSFDAHTKNTLVRVQATIRVQRGEVNIELPGCAQANQGVARPGHPVVIACDTKLNRNDFSFSLWARPRALPVEGVDGEVTFRPI